MKFVECTLPGILRIQPQIFGDSRGDFFEGFNIFNFRKLVNDPAVHFVQFNESSSQLNVLRGLHFQIERPQGKLVRFLKGSALDVVVDLRLDSPSFLKHEKFELGEHTREYLWIPPGFAHGFKALTRETVCQYHVTDVWHPESEMSLAWDDPSLAIDWGNTDSIIVSQKDKAGRSIEEVTFALKAFADD